MKEPVGETIVTILFRQTVAKHGTSFVVVH
jgi:hypothetical protein